MQPPTPTNKFKTGVRAGGEEIACQRKYVGGEDRYGRYSTTYRIESPQKVGRVFYPAGHAPAGSDTGLAYAARQLRQDTITATAKDDSPGICDWDKDGRPNCSVSVNPSSIDLADTGWTEPGDSFVFRWSDNTKVERIAVLLDVPECRTLEDLLKSPTFKDAADRAWDRSLQGKKHEEGAHFFYTPDNPGFSSWDIPRNPQSVFLPWDPERALEVAKSNQVIWTATLHTHIWRHGEKQDGTEFARPWDPSTKDVRTQKQHPKIWHITLYPSFDSYAYFVMIDGVRVEPQYWRNYFRCAWKRTTTR